MTALERLGGYLANGKDLPPLARANARLRLIDGVGAWVAGLGTAEGRALLAFRREAPDADGVSAAHAGALKSSEPSTATAAFFMNRLSESDTL